jgi:hypothetical protein
MKARIVLTELGKPPLDAQPTTWQHVSIAKMKIKKRARSAVHTMDIRECLHPTHSGH